MGGTSSPQTISAKQYETVRDKVLYVQRELLRFLADYQSSSFSYISVRPIFIKKGFLKRNLDDESTKAINELLDVLLNVRNWTFHNAQSMLVADLEHAKKTIPSELVGIAEIHPMLNPVIIRRPKSYSRPMLEEFIHHNEVRIKQFDTILSEMKKDYQELYDLYCSTPLVELMSAEPSKRAEIIKDMSFLNSTKIQNNEADVEKIKNILMKIIREIKEDVTVQQPTGAIATAEAVNAIRDSLPDKPQSELTIDDVSTAVATYVGTMLPMDENTSALLQQLAKQMLETPMEGKE